MGYQLLKLDNLSSVDQALSNQVVAVALQSVHEDMREATRRFDLPHELVRGEAKNFAQRVDNAIHLADHHEGVGDRDRINLGLIALAVAERNAILERIRERTFPLRLAERAIADADRLIDGARVAGRTGYRRTAQDNINYRRGYRMVAFAHNYLGWSSPLARIVEERFEVLVSQQVIFADLEGFIDARIRRLHGKRVAELLQDMLERRKATVETALEGLRLQFPGYAEELARSIIQRAALRLEEKEYNLLRDQSLVGSELHTALIQNINTRRGVAEQRMKLDLAVQRNELIRQYPLFADLDNPSLQRLARKLQARYFNANTVIVDKDQLDKQVYFIASGAVEIENAGRLTRHGLGEMFGMMSFLPAKHKRIRVRTIVPSTLLVLDEVKFHKLLEQNPTLKERVYSSRTLE